MEQFLRGLPKSLKIIAIDDCNVVDKDLHGWCAVHIDVHNCLEFERRSSIIRDRADLKSFHARKFFSLSNANAFESFLHEFHLALSHCRSGQIYFALYPTRNFFLTTMGKIPENLKNRIRQIQEFTTDRKTLSWIKQNTMTLLWLAHMTDLIRDNQSYIILIDRKTPVPENAQIRFGGKNLKVDPNFILTTLMNSILETEGRHAKILVQAVNEKDFNIVQAVDVFANFQINQIFTGETNHSYEKKRIMDQIFPDETYIPSREQIQTASAEILGDRGSIFFKVSASDIVNVHNGIFDDRYQFYDH